MILQGDAGVVVLEDRVAVVFATHTIRCDLARQRRCKRGGDFAIRTIRYDFALARPCACGWGSNRRQYGLILQEPK